MFLTNICTFSTLANLQQKQILGQKTQGNLIRGFTWALLCNLCVSSKENGQRMCGD